MNAATSTAVHTAVNAALHGAARGAIAEGGAARVVIVGSGFAGLALARGLGGARVDITVVDRRNHHLFQPLLYQVATASLSPADIAAPIRKVLSHQRNTRVLLGSAVRVDADSRRLVLADGSLEYDVLCLCCGVTHSYFGHPGWEADAPGLKTIEDAVEIRRRFLLAFEAAERETDGAARAARLTFVVVGGGPTGVELAGAMVEIARRSIPRDFRSIDTASARIILVEGTDRLLGGFAPELSEHARRDLESLGVVVMLSTRVTSVDARGVMIGDRRIDAGNVIWAAGVQAEGLAGTIAGPAGPAELCDRAGRVLVTPRLTVPGRPEIFVLGDLAAITDEWTGAPVPGIAHAAMQMGRYAARIIARRAERGDVGAEDPDAPPFRYRDKGMLATIGRARAVAQIRGWRFTGLPAWLLWAAVHIFFLIDFRNRLSVMLHWAWEWFFFQRGARLITGDAEMHLGPGLMPDGEADGANRKTAYPPECRQDVTKS